MIVDDELHLAVGSPAERLDNDQIAVLDETLFNDHASPGYENPEFFTPKEISSLTATLIPQILSLIARDGVVAVDNIRTAANLAAVMLTLALDDTCLQRSFEVATKIVNPGVDILVDARRRFGAAMEDGNDPGEPAP